jgi:hypothetical protein
MEVDAKITQEIKNNLKLNFRLFLILNDTPKIFATYFPGGGVTHRNAVKHGSPLTAIFKKNPQLSIF